MAVSWKRNGYSHRDWTVGTCPRENCSQQILNICTHTLIPQCQLWPYHPPLLLSVPICSLEHHIALLTFPQWIDSLPSDNYWDHTTHSNYNKPEWSSSVLPKNLSFCTSTWWGGLNLFPLLAPEDGAFPDASEVLLAQLRVVPVPSPLSTLTVQRGFSMTWHKE